MWGQCSRTSLYTQISLVINSQDLQALQNTKKGEIMVFISSILIIFYKLYGCNKGETTISL